MVNFMDKLIEMNEVGEIPKVSFEVTLLESGHLQRCKEYTTSV